MIFGQETVDLHDDGFDESGDELRISQEVFYGNVAGFCNKRSDAAISASEENKMAELSVSLHSEGSAVTNQVSSKDLCQKDADTMEIQSTSGAQESIEGSIIGAKIDHDVHAKRMKLSVNELSDFKPYLDKAVASSIPMKQVVSGMYHPPQNSSCQVLMCHVVESSREGVKSSCYLLNQCPESDRKGNLGDGSAANGSMTGSDRSEVKQVDSGKSIASPISQESSATKLLVSSPPAAQVSEPGSVRRAKRRPKRDFAPELEDDEVLLTTDSMKDSRALLRSRVLHLLKRAGWSTEKRKRNTGSYRYIYRSPEGKLFRELRKVWNLFGESLRAHGNYEMAGDDKQWTDVGQFWSDLYDTLRYIESRMDDWEPRYALARQWSLLNPFVNLVLVDRKIHTLRAGNPVKANQSNVVIVGSKAEANCRLKPMEGGKKRSVGRNENIVCDSSLVSDHAVVDGAGQFKQGLEVPKSKSIYVSEGNSLRLVKTISKIENRSLGTCTDENMPTCVSNSTCVQSSSSLYDVPVGNANINVIFGQSETFSHHQDSCMSSPSCNKLNTEPARGNGKDIAGHLLDGGVAPLERVNIDRADNVDSSNKLSANLFEHQSGLERSRFWKSDHSTHHNNCCLNEINSENDADEACLHAQNDSIESQSCRKGRRPKKHASSKRRSKACQLKDDDLLISAIIKKRSSSTKQRGAEPRKLKLKPPKKRKTQKGSCRLLLRSLGKGGKHFTERWSVMGERTVLSWLISAGAIFINEVIQYRDMKDDVVVKDGLITRDGILCKCCSEVFSVSGFKIHAGFKQNRPCLNLFMGSGRPFTLCQLQAWSAEYKTRRTSTRSTPVDEFDKNDDSCGLCGDGGELLCCDNCPSTFHQSCLSAEELPEGSWYCLNCTCRVCGDLVNDKETSSSYVALKCAQCEQKYHDGCLMEKGVDRVGGSIWFCGIGCEEVYGGLQSRIGLSNLIGDGYSWTLLRCIHDDQKVPSPQRFALKAECNSKLAVAVTIMEECFLSMTDPRTGIDMIPQVVYNWGSEFARLNYHGFYTVILEKDDVLISIASIRVHGVAVAEMPLIATCSKYRRQGMCRRLLTSIEKMLISLKVEKLVIAAISDLVETWTVGFGFIPMEEDEKRSLNNINLMVFPGTVMLKKILYVNQGAQDVSPFEKNESFDIRGCLEGEPVREIKCGTTEQNSIQEVDVDVDAQRCSEAAGARMESELLNRLVSSAYKDKDTNITGFRLLEGLSGHSDTEVVSKKETSEAGKNTDTKISSGETSKAEDYMGLQSSALGSEIKYDDNPNLLAVKDRNNCLLVTKDQAIVEAVRSMEFPTVEDNSNNEAETIVGDKPQSMDEDNALTQIAKEYMDELISITDETSIEVPDVVSQDESTVMEAEAKSELRLSVQNQVEEAEKSVSEANNASENTTPKLMDLEAVKADESAAGCMEKGVKSDDKLEPPGSLDSVFSLRKCASGQCFEHDVPILARGEVSGSETLDVNDSEKELSLIEQSQEGSALPQS